MQVEVGEVGGEGEVQGEIAELVEGEMIGGEETLRLWVPAE